LQGAGGIGGLLARSADYSGGVFSQHDYYHADGQGNITYLEDNTQSQAASYAYDPYGNLLSSAGTLATANTYRFSSREYVPSSGLYVYLYRFYNPGTERWLNQDTFQEAGGINLYGFVHNDSVNFGDPYGLGWWQSIKNFFCPQNTNKNAIPSAETTSDATLESTDTTGTTTGTTTTTTTTTTGSPDTTTTVPNDPVYPVYPVMQQGPIPPLSPPPFTEPWPVLRGPSSPMPPRSGPPVRQGPIIIIIGPIKFPTV
jgi:RHS repeat-associated protein